MSDHVIVFLAKDPKRVDSNDEELRSLFLPGIGKLQTNDEPPTVGERRFAEDSERFQGLFGPSVGIGDENAARRDAHLANRLPASPGVEHRHDGLAGQIRRGHKPRGIGVAAMAAQQQSAKKPTAQAPRPTVLSSAACPGHGNSMYSRPERVPKARQMESSTVLETGLVEPSTISTFTPPG